MDAIELRADLQEELQKDAEREARSVSDIVNDAVERYLHEQAKTKIAQEVEAYTRMYTELKRRYFQKWVAIHNQKLIDYDDDRTALYLRVHEKYGRISILIREVGEQPEDEIWLRTWRTGKIEP